jgi:hypothetical protein
VAPKGFGVAATPWRAAQIAASAALRTKSNMNEYPGQLVRDAPEPKRDWDEPSPDSRR